MSSPGLNAFISGFVPSYLQGSQKAGEAGMEMAKMAAAQKQAQEEMLMNKAKQRAMLAKEGMDESGNWSSQFMGQDKDPWAAMARHKREEELQEMTFPGGQTKLVSPVQSKFYDSIVNSSGFPGLAEAYPDLKQGGLSGIGQGWDMKSAQAKMGTGEYPTGEDLAQLNMRGTTGKQMAQNWLAMANQKRQADQFAFGKQQQLNEFNQNKAIQREATSTAQTKDLEEKYNKRPDKSILANLDVIDKNTKILSDPEHADLSKLPGRLMQQAESAPLFGGLATLGANQFRDPQSAQVAASIRAIINSRAHELYGARLTATEISALMGEQGATPQDLANALRKIYQDANSSIRGLHKSHPLADQSITQDSDAYIRGVDQRKAALMEAKKRGLVK